MMNSRGEFWTHVFVQERGQVAEVERVHGCELHGEELEPQKTEEELIRVQSGTLVTTLHGIGWFQQARSSYLDLPLKRLHVVYDLIKHQCLANHLKVTQILANLIVSLVHKDCLPY